MAAPTRFTSGIATTKNGAMAQMGLPDPTKFKTYFNDFLTIKDFNSTDWTTTEVGNGTQVLTDSDGGELVMTNAAADNDSSTTYPSTEFVQLAANKKMAFKARFKVSDATQSDVFIGLSTKDTTPIGGNDQLAFVKLDGTTELTLRMEKDNTATETATGINLADDTYIIVEMLYDGKSAVEVFANGAKITTIARDDNFVDDEPLTVAMAIINGEAVSKVMTVDYILVVQER